MFKINKRKLSNPKGSSTLFLIPLFTYLQLNFLNVEFQREYLWPIGICALFIFWFFLNFKILKK